MYLKVNAEKTQYTFVSCHQNAGQNNNLMIANRSLKMWQSSKWQKQIKIAFTKKLRLE
jgi:tRNA A37 threonylcarbamoyltransferase TsaD